MKEIEFTLTPIPPSKPKKMDFGTLAVCSKCGTALLNREGKCCGNIISLKKYVEEVKGEVFNNEDWSFGESNDITNFDGFNKE